MTHADSPRGLGMPPARVESPEPGDDVETSYLPPPPGGSLLRIRVYDVCPDGTRHTDPDLLAIEGAYL